MDSCSKTGIFLLRGVAPPMFNRRAALQRLQRACLRNHARPGPALSGGRKPMARTSNIQRSLQALLCLLPWSELAFLSRASAWALGGGFVRKGGHMQQDTIGTPFPTSWVYSRHHVVHFHLILIVAVSVSLALSCLPSWRPMSRWIGAWCWPIASKGIRS